MVAKGKVYLFAGDDDVAKDAEVRKIKAELLTKGSESFDFDIFHSQGSKADDIITRAKTHPALSKTRIIVLKDIAHLKQEDRDKILEYCKNPQLTTCLIISTPYEPKDQYFNSLKELAALKMFNAAKERKPLSTFDLMDALLDRRAGPALKAASFLLDKGDMPHQIIGSLARQYRNMIEAKRLMIKGEGRESIRQDLKIHPYFLDKFMAQVEKSDIKILKRDIEKLLKADLDMKTGRFSPALVAELLTVDLCRPGKPAST